jgi:hypothetical protein
MGGNECIRTEAARICADAPCLCGHWIAFARTCLVQADVGLCLRGRTVFAQPRVASARTDFYQRGR